MAVIKGVNAAIYIAQYPATTMTNEATTANVAKTVFTIDDATKRFIDPDTAIVIDYPDNATPVTSYASIQKPGGVVTWAVTPGAGSVFITGKYLAITQVAQAYGWALTFEPTDIEYVIFGAAGKARARAIVGATISFDRFFNNAAFFTEAESANVRIGVDLFEDTTAGVESRMTCYCRVASMGTSSSAEDLVRENVTLAVIDGPYAVAGLA
jgi:hypothetical protein